MSRKSYAEQISKAQVIQAGLERNADQLAQRGITGTFISRLGAKTAEAITLNNEQEKLKADLKTQTAQVVAKLEDLAKDVAEAKKIVKMDFPKERWKEFGIEDKR